MNDMRERSIAVAEQIKSWAELLEHFGIEYQAIDTNTANIICPNCRCAGTFKKRKPYPIWSCANKCQLIFFDSFAGLFRAATKAKGNELSPGRVLGKCEQLALEKIAAGTLPDELVGFGKYQNVKWISVPKNYLKWLISERIVKGDLAAVICSHLNIPISQPEPMIHF